MWTFSFALPSTSDRKKSRHPFGSGAGADFPPEGLTEGVPGSLLDCLLLRLFELVFEFVVAARKMSRLLPSLPAAPDRDGRRASGATYHARSQRKK